MCVASGLENDTLRRSRDFLDGVRVSRIADFGLLALLWRAEERESERPRSAFTGDDEGMLSE